MQTKSIIIHSQQIKTMYTFIAKFNFWLLYEIGELIPPSIEKSIYYYEAQFCLGKIYEKDEKIPQDMNKCKCWWY